MPFAPGRGSLPPFKFVVIKEPSPPIPEVFTTIFSDSPGDVSGSNAANQNYRQVIPSSFLTPDTTDNQIRVIFEFGPVVNCTINAWIGTQAATGNAYNFDGTQVQLFFAGSDTAPCTNGGNLVSDWAPYTTYNAAKNIIVSMYFTGTSVFPQEHGSTGQSIWFLSAASQVGVTAPTGSWGQSTPDLQGVMIIEMRPSPTVVGLIAVAMSNAFGNATAGVAAALKAAAKSAGEGWLGGFSGQAALKATSISTGRGRFGFIGTVGLSARAAAISAGRVTISIVIPLALLAVSAALGIGRAASTNALKLQSAAKSAAAAVAQFSGVVTLHAFVMAHAAGRITAAGRASLQAITEAVSAARAASVGKAALASRGLSRAVSTAAQSGLVPIIARSAGMATGRVTAGFKAALQSVGSSTAVGRASTIGKVALAARTLARSSAQVAISTLTAGMVAMIAASRGAMAMGRAITFGRAPLLSRAAVMAKARAAASYAAGLASISLNRGGAVARPTGILTLTSATSAKSTGSVQPSLFVPFIALSAFGRSIANAFGALFLKQKLFVDPNYIVQYQAPFRIVQYPDTDITAQYPAPVRSVSYPGN